MRVCVVSIGAFSHRERLQDVACVDGSSTPGCVWMLARLVSAGQSLSDQCKWHLRNHSDWVVSPPVAAGQITSFQQIDIITSDCTTNGTVVWH